MLCGQMALEASPSGRIALWATHNGANRDKSEDRVDVSQERNRLAADPFAPRLRRVTRGLVGNVARNYRCEAL